MKYCILIFTILSFLFVGCSDTKDEEPIDIPSEEEHPNGKPGDENEDEDDNDDEEEKPIEEKKPYQYDADKVFDKNFFIGTWELAESYNANDDQWTNIQCVTKSYISLDNDGSSDFYDPCNNMEDNKPGKWTFDEKNIVDFFVTQYSDIRRYSLFLIDASEDALIVGLNDQNNVIKLKKTNLDLDDYYTRYTNGYKVRDTVNFVPLWNNIKDDKAYLIGTKDQKLWIGTFDVNTKEQLFEVKDSEDLNWTKKIHIGYGEYDEQRLTKISVDNVYNNHKTYVLNIDFENYSIYYSLIWFPETKKKYEKYNDEAISSLLPWHNRSFLVFRLNMDDSYSYSCLSEDGNIIFKDLHLGNYALEHAYFYPIDYKQTVLITNVSTSFDFFIGRFTESEYTPDVKLVKMLTLGKKDNLKYNISFLSRNNNIMTFKIDITEYSGEKHSHTVDIDINAERIP